MKGLTIALLSLVSALASAANISISSAYPSDGAGNAVDVKLGESFYMTAKLVVDSDLNGTYRVQFALPYASRTTPDLAFGGDATVTWGPYDALLDGPIMMTVNVQSDSDTAGQPLTIEIDPVRPKTAIETFDPRTLNGSLRGVATLSNGNSSGLQWFSPLPTNTGFQKVLSATSQGTRVTSMPFSQPVASTTKVSSVSVSFETMASSVRSNSTLLRTATFASYAKLPSDASMWLKPETLVESQSGEIAAWVNKNLPRNFKQTMKPYDAAQKLFQATVARIQYASVTTRPDAVQALRTGKGDCGFFSALFVAGCRNVGIPARTVCGMTIGDNNWHVWAEFYVPGSGWVPVDPSYCDALVPDGSQPLYFGTIPDLNQRVAVTNGFDHVASGKSMAMLQSPCLFVSGASRVSSVQTYCSLAIGS